MGWDDGDTEGGGVVSLRTHHTHPLAAKANYFIIIAADDHGGEIGCLQKEVSIKHH